MTRRASPDDGYLPAPLSFDHVEIPADVAALVETLAEFNHDAWAHTRYQGGWRHGPERNDDLKQHPCLVPYSDLSEEEKEVDRQTARTVIRAVLGLGFDITRR